MTDTIKEQPIEDTIPRVDNALQGLPDEYIPDLPYVKETPGLLIFNWPTYNIEARVTHFDNLRGHTDIEIWYYVKETGHEKLILPKTDLALKSVSARCALANDLKKDLYLIPWEWIVTCIAYKCIELSQRQNPTIEIVSQPGLSLEPDYLLRPILYRGHPTVIFGDKGSTKSLLGLVVAYIVQLPLARNRLGLTTDSHTCVVLYLDYEAEELGIRKQWTAIQNGFKAIEPQNPNDKIPADLEVPLLYKRMSTRLADSVEALRPEIADNHINLLIVDSLGPAAKGKLNDPEPAIDYHTALRSLGVTSLTIAHNSKDPLTKKRSIFGSVFFSNLARSIWECKAEQERTDNEVIISLKQTEANLSAKSATFGYKWAFSNLENRISIERTSLEGTSLSGELPLSVQIRNLLRNGAKTLDEMVSDLDVDRNTIKTTVYRLSKRDILTKAGTTPDGADQWGLKQQ